MIIVKTTQKQKRLKKWKEYNSDKKLQVVMSYSNPIHYLNNIKEQFVLLGSLLITFISIPFLIMWQLIMCLNSFQWWTLIYTKKKMEDDPLVVEGVFKKPKDGE